MVNNSSNEPTNSPDSQSGQNINPRSPASSPDQTINRAPSRPGNTTDEFAAPSTPYRQPDPSVRPKTRNVSFDNNSSKTANAIKSESPQVQGICPNSSKSNNSPRTQNLGQVSADGKLIPSGSDEISDGVGFQSLKSHPPELNNQLKFQLQSLGEESDPDPDDFGGTIDLTSGSSASLESNNDQVPQISPALPSSSNKSIASDVLGPDSIQRKLEDLSLDSPKTDYHHANNEKAGRGIPSKSPSLSNSSTSYANDVSSPDSLQKKLEDLSLDSPKTDHQHAANGKSSNMTSTKSFSPSPKKMEDLSLDSSEFDGSNSSTTGQSSSMMSTDVETDAPDGFDTTGESTTDVGSGSDIKSETGNAQRYIPGKVNVGHEETAGVLPESHSGVVKNIRSETGKVQRSISEKVSVGQKETAGVLPESHTEAKQSIPSDQNGIQQNQPGIQRGIAAVRASEVQAVPEDDTDAAGDEAPGDPNPEESPKQLRAYQKELATPPLSGNNYIICAPTGSGKTLTAAYICQQSYKEAIANEVDFKALFIVNIRHLTRQQRREFKEKFPRGAVRTIDETEQLKDVLFADGVYVVMVTAQIVVNALNKGDISLQDLTMMIFDECHHTTQNHPYNEIMKRYLKEKKIKLGLRRVIGESGNRLPHVIGLSASLGVGHGKAFDHVLTLCGNMDAKNVLQVRENKKELEDHVNAPENDAVRYVPPRKADQRGLSDIIEGIMSQIERELWGEEDILHEHGTQGYVQWIKKQETDAGSSPDERIKYIASLYLFRYNNALILFEDLRSSDSLTYLEEFMIQRDLEQDHVAIEELCRGLFEAEKVELKRISREEERDPNPKLQELANLLREIYESKPDSKGKCMTYI